MTLALADGWELLEIDAVRQHQDGQPLSSISTLSLAVLMRSDRMCSSCAQGMTRHPASRSSSRTPALNAEVSS
jgi:hypothetical protein